MKASWPSILLAEPLAAKLSGQARWKPPAIVPANFSADAFDAD
jgi:hypothetical protein